MTGEYLDEIASERARQDSKWGQQNHDDGRWCLVLTEEVGEACQASLKGQVVRLREELIQSAAVIVAWLEALDRRTPAP